jgi:hypothetical protein
VSNQTFGACSQTREQAFARYDRLPPRLREVYQRAPYSFFVETHARAIAGGGQAVERERAALLAGIMGRVRKQCARTYGPDHPNLTHGFTPLKSRRLGRRA